MFNQINPLKVYGQKRLAKQRGKILPSLFANLFKYRASDGRTPEEDFFTEVLAGVLNTSTQLRVAFVLWLTGRKVKSVRVVTQMKFQDSGGSGRFDMWLQAKDDAGEKHLIVVENKIDARVGSNQLSRYKRYLEEQGSVGSRTLVYFTLRNLSNFQQSGEQSAVDFRDHRWFEVYDWLEEWKHGNDQSTGDHSAPLVDELQALMEDWEMDMKLSADDLTVATRYHLWAQPRLIKILEEVKDNLENNGKWNLKGNWKYETDELKYSSPLVAKRNFEFEFGFDFEREDDAWSVSGLRLLSAYFAVRVGKGNQINWSGLPDDWVTPPDHLRLSNGSGSKDRVKQLNRLNLTKADGASLLNVYLNFFLGALEEVEKAM